VREIEEWLLKEPLVSYKIRQVEVRMVGKNRSCWTKENENIVILQQRFHDLSYYTYNCNKIKKITLMLLLLHIQHANCIHVQKQCVVINEI